MSEAVAAAPQESLLGRWDQVIRRPDPALRPFVRAYTGYISRAVPPRSRHLPSAGVAMIIEFASALRVIGPDTLPDNSQRRTSFVAGMHESYSDTEWLGLSRGVQVDFTPAGAYLFCGVPMHTLTNRVVAVEDLLGREGVSLVERLMETPGWDSRFQMLESFVAGRLVCGREPSHEVMWAWGEIERLGGTASISALATELGWSRRRLISRFREQIGVAPKTSARVIRFNRVVQALDGQCEPDWAGVAIQGGYYDQSHLIREFREFAGATPERLLSMRREGGGFSLD